MGATPNLLATAVLCAAALRALAAQPAPDPAFGPAPPRAGSTLLDASRRDAARFARELPKDKAAGGAVLRSGRQARLDRAFDEAYAAAHAGGIEEVTKAFDGDDRMYTIRTPFGKLCWNWRDVDRHDIGKGKTAFVGVCNR